MGKQVIYRYATKDDIPVILQYTKDLAIYLESPEYAVATPELIEKWMFEKKAAEALIAEHPDDGVVACAIFFQQFSTWSGKCGMYLEDLYVKEGYRGGGIGRGIMAQLARICKEREWSRIDWTCLDWNKGSLHFYKSIGAITIDEWIHHRLWNEELDRLAKEAE